MSHPETSSRTTVVEPAASRLNWLAKPAFWFAVALLIRLLYLLEQGGSSPLFYMPLLDEKEAVDSAKEILNGVRATEPYFKAPGYSWLLAAVMALTGEAWPWAIRSLQHICGAWMVYFTAKVSAGLVSAGKPRVIAIAVAGAMGAAYAPLIRLENNLGLDFWVVFFQSAMLAQLARAALARSNTVKPVIMAGLLAAAAWLTRPTLTIALPLLVLWLVYVSKGSVKPRKIIAITGAFILPVLLVALGVAIRNQAVSHEPLIMPWQGGYSFYQANRPGATGRYFVQSDEVETSHANPAHALAVNGYVSSLQPHAQKQFQLDPTYSKINEFWFSKGKEAIKANPAGWLALMGKKHLYLLSDKEIFNYEEFDLQRSLSPILKWLPGRFGVAFPLALASLPLLFSIGIRRRLHALLWLYAASLGFAIALYFVSGRMRMPLAFPAIALAGAGVAAILAGTRKQQVAATSLLVLGLIISWGDWWGVRSESMAHADLARMSNAAWHRDRPEHALDYALQAEKLVPDYPVLPRLKAQALYNLGRVDEARAEFIRSVKVLNDDTSKRNLEIIRQMQAAPPPDASTTK